MKVLPEAPYKIFGEYAVNMHTLTFSWLVMLILIFLAWRVTRNLQRHPGRGQVIWELIVGAFDKLCIDTLGERGRKYVPYVGTLFLFLWGSNMIGIIPFCEEPTRDINVPVGLAVIAITISQVSAIRVNGAKAWVMEFFEPGITIKGRWWPNLPMFPLNVVGEIGKAVSLPFRLFGNIFGGAVIILVATALPEMLLGAPPILTPFLNAFFGIFVGTIQAFVFTMLSLTYVAVAIGDTEEEVEAEEGNAG
jgi:F-type H+-transporting ATPase subunit a